MQSRLPRSPPKPFLTLSFSHPILQPLSFNIHLLINFCNSLGKIFDSTFHLLLIKIVFLCLIERKEFDLLLAWIHPKAEQFILLDIINKPASNFQPKVNFQKESKKRVSKLPFSAN
jgi:hypothetical protein